MGPKITVPLTGVRGKGKVGSVGWTQVREYLERHPAPLIVSVLLTLGSSAAGLVLGRWWGFVVGLILSAAGSFVGLYAFVRVRIEKGG